MSTEGNTAGSRIFLADLGAIGTHGHGHRHECRVDVTGVPAATSTTTGKIANTAAESAAVERPMPKISAIHGRIRIFGMP